jgi:hypothetical protein
MPIACMLLFVYAFGGSIDTGPTEPPAVQLSLPGVSREAAIADNGMVPTGQLDRDLVSHGAATDAGRGSPPAPTGVPFNRGPGYARPCHGAHAEVEVVGT